MMRSIEQWLDETFYYGAGNEVMLTVFIGIILIVLIVVFDVMTGNF